MTLNKERKVLAGLLGLGLAVFATDRLFLAGATEPADAGAGQYAATPNPSSTPVATAAAMSLPKPNEQSIARRLSRYAAAAAVDPTEVREAFTPSESWVPPMVEIAPAAKQPTVVEQDPREAFVARHQLGGIAGSGPTALAIVDGQPLRLGQRLDGFTLVEVTQRSAVFASAAGRVELTLRR